MSPRSSARKKLVTKFRTSSSLITLALGGGVVRVGTGVDGGGDCDVRVGTGVETGVTAADVIGTGVVSLGVMAYFSAPLCFSPRYHPAPPTITNAATMIATRIALRPDGRTGGVGIDDLSG